VYINKAVVNDLQHVKLYSHCMQYCAGPNSTAGNACIRTTQLSNTWKDIVAVFTLYTAPHSCTYCSMQKLNMSWIEWTLHTFCATVSSSPCGSACLPIFLPADDFFFGFSPRKGKPLHQLGSNLAGCIRYALPNLTPVGPYLGIYGRKTPQIATFCNFFAPQGWLPQPIFLKFTELVCSYSLHTRLIIWWDSVHKSGIYNWKTVRRSFLMKNFGGPSTKTRSQIPN